MKKFVRFFTSICIAFMIALCFSGCELFDFESLLDKYKEENGITAFIYDVEIQGDRQFVINSEFDPNQFTLLVTFTDETQEEATMDDVEILTYPDMSRLGISEFKIDILGEEFTLYILIVESK